ncbi:PilZ domain-containing protein [Rhizobium paknamense]|uniref:PilZ domain-containing protein n=1 Tax=Rhizobium paknamense TaxID=1206817 RepID=A0ABU0IHA5_9HYPH|nr:PilZ domain-containing protein [Rhizobium paknamense]MDQ0457648.1 hypothetical protein [Rhizobium paknamense]
MVCDQARDSVPPREPTVERPRRTRVLKGGLAAFHEGHSAVPCIVRDLSDTGAKIELDVGWIVPSHFTLFVELDGFKVECEKVWHRGNLYGVRFTGSRVGTNPARRQRIDLCDTTEEVETGIAPAPKQTIDKDPRRPVFGKLK